MMRGIGVRRLGSEEIGAIHQDKHLGIPVQDILIEIRWDDDPDLRLSVIDGLDRAGLVGSLWQ